MSGLEKLEDRIKADLENFNDTNSFKQINAVKSFGEILYTNWSPLKDSLVQEKVAESFPIFKERIISSDNLDVKKAIIEFFGLLTFLEESYSFLLELFLTGKEPLSYYAAEAMVGFTAKREKTKGLFFDVLRESTNEYLRYIAIGVLGNRFQNHFLNEIKSITKKIAKEDKYPKVRQLAWKRFVLIASQQEVTQEKVKIHQEALYRALFEILTLFRPDIPVSFSRIIDLSKNLAVEKVKETLETVDPSHFNFSPEYIEGLISEIVEQKFLSGEFLSLEHVFIRSQDTENPILEPIAISKEYICYYCGYPIEKESKSCSNCNEKVLNCIVCKLPISFGEESGKCYFCERSGHLSHIQEWVKVKGKCPTCLKELTITGIIPLTQIVRE